MTLTVATIIEDARSRHPFFRRERVPHKVLLTFLSGYQKALVAKAQLLNPEFLTAQGSIVFAASTSNAVGTVGAGTAGGLPVTDSGGTVTTVDSAVGNLAEFDTTTAVVLVAERPATSATASTISSSTAAWTVNAYATKYVEVTAGMGAGQGLREVVSNTATQLTIDGTWATTPDTTSLFRVVDVAATVPDDLGVVAAFPTTGTRSGYLARYAANGTVTLDLTQPVTATFAQGMSLPTIQYLLGGTVYFTGDSTLIERLTIVSYQHRFQPSGRYCVYLVGGQVFLCGIDADWEQVASIDLRWVPEPPDLTATTDLFVVPDTAYHVLVSQAAAFAAQRVAALPDVQGFDPEMLIQQGMDAEALWVKQIAGQRRVFRSTVIETW